MITVSAPAKLHLLGEHAVVYGKPALLAAIDLRVSVTVSKTHPSHHPLKKIIEPIIKKELNIKKIPPYQLIINSEAPIGAGLGSSAAVSASYIAALLIFLKIKWDLDLINKLTYEAEKTFQGNPSGGDNSTVVYGGLIWFRKESEELKIIQPLNTKFVRSKNFGLIQTGTPKESTADMVKHVKKLYDRSPNLVRKFLEEQESLVRQLLSALKTDDAAMMIRIIRAGEKNLESIGVCSPSVKKVIRQIEESGGAAKICGAGAANGPTGVLLCYHQNRSVIEKIAKSYNLDYFKAALGVGGLRIEK